MNMHLCGVLIRLVPTIFAAFINAQEPPTVEEVLAVQENWLQQFASIRVSWKEWHRVDVMQYHPSVPRDASLENSPVYSLGEFCWSDMGRLSHETVTYRASKPNFRSIYGTDGQIGWDSETKPNGDLEQWDHVKILRPDTGRPLKTSLTMVAIDGLWDSSGEWWTSRLRNASALVMLEPENIEDHQCVVVQLKWRDNATDLEETLWLDQSVEFLPRKRRIKAKTADAAWENNWICDRFQEVSPGFHFPAHGFFHLDKIPQPGFEWVIEKVEVNSAFPPEQFQPRVSVGSRVTDYPGGRAYIAGPRGLKQEPDPLPPTPHVNSGSTAIALPPTTNWRAVAVFAGLILALLLTLKWLRNGRGPIGV